MARKSILENRDTPVQSGPPSAEDVLTEVASNWLNSRLVHKADPGIPRNPRDLASWWMKHQQQPDHYADRPTQHTKRDQTGTYWKTPYIDRVKYTLTKFLHEEKDFQRIIIAAAEEGIFWRGDSRSFFMGLIAERDKAKSPGYKTEAIRKMQSLPSLNPEIRNAQGRVGTGEV